MIKICLDKFPICIGHTSIFLNSWITDYNRSDWNNTFFLSALYEFNNKNKTNKNVLLDEKEKSEGVAISTKRNESRIEPREAAYISFRIILFETAQQGPANSSIILSPTVRFHQSSVVELVEDILYIRPSRLNIHKTAPLYTHNRVRNVVCHDSR